MPYCPRCRGEFRPEIEKCEKCQEFLVAELIEESFGESYSPRAMARLLVDRDVVPIFAGSVQGITELRDAFAFTRIPVAVADTPEDCRGCQPKLTLLAAREDADRAIDFYYDEFQSGLGTAQVQVLLAGEPGDDLDDGGPNTCPACSATYTPGPEAQCPDCGIFLG